jgi:hypothetical protein
MTTASDPLNLSFDAQSFDSVGQINGGIYEIPPDPSLAVGLSNIVTTANGQVDYFDKSGDLQASLTLDNFFTISGIPSSGAFDPRVIYDATANRFVASASVGGEVCVAVSKDGNPNDGWITSSYNWSFSENSGGFADYPCLSTDGKSVFITANIFNSWTGSETGSLLWALPNALSVGPTGILPFGQVFDPSTATGLASTSELDTMQPAKIVGTPPGQIGAFLVSYGGAHDGSGNSLITIVSVDDTLSPGGALLPNFSRQVINVGNIDLNRDYEMSASQASGAMPIDANDSRVTDAVWSNGFLYVVATVNPSSGPDAGVPQVHWFKFDTANLANITLVDQGNVDGSSIAPGTATFDGSIAVDGLGSFIINFSASGPDINPGSYYAMHTASDAAGTLETPVALAAGQGSYLRTFGAGSNRWGDYSGAVVDPSNSRTFWLYNEYAQTPGDNYFGDGETGRWGTRVGEVIDDRGPVAAALSATSWIKPDQPAAVNTFFSISDPDGDSITQYEVFLGSFTSPVGTLADRGGTLPDKTNVYESNLGDVTYEGSTIAGTDRLWVRAYDGLVWGNWSYVDLTGAPPPTMATPQGTEQRVTDGQAFQLTSLFSANEPSGDPITQYNIYEGSFGSTPVGTLTGASGLTPFQNDTVTSLNGITYGGGASAGTDRLWVQAYADGQWGNWVYVDMNNVGVPPPTMTTLASTEQSVTNGQTVLLTSLFSATTPSGDQITQYNVYEGSFGTPVGTLTDASGTLPAFQNDAVTSLAGLTYTGGASAGTDRLWVHAFDGQWSNWVYVDMNDAGVTPPTMATPQGTKQSVANAQAAQLTSLFSATAPSGDPITQYNVYEGSFERTPVGTLTDASGTLPAFQNDTVTSLTGLTYTGGASAGTDRLWVQAFDGQWSNWVYVDMNDVGVPPPTMSAAGPQTDAPNQSVALSSLFSATAPAGDPITQYQIYEGSFDKTPVGSLTDASGTVTPFTYVTLSSLNGLTYNSSNSTAGTDRLWVQAFDGQWSNWAYVDMNNTGAGTSSSATATAGSTSLQVAQLVQAMASFSSTTGALATSPIVTPSETSSLGILGVNTQH